MRRRFEQALLLLCIGLILLPSVALSSRPAVVLPIEGSFQALGQSLTIAIRRALSDYSDLADLGIIDFSLSEAKSSFDCDDEDESCMATIGQTIGVEVMFWGRIERSGDDVLVKLRGLDVGRKALVYGLTERFRDRYEIEGNLSQIADAFLGGDPSVLRSQPRLSVASSPVAATVRLNGRIIGSTPVDVEVRRGQIELELEAPGYRRVVEQISVDTSSIKRDYSLVPVNSLGAALQSSWARDRELSRRRKGLSGQQWVGVGLSAAALGVGAYYLKLQLEVLDARDKFPGPPTSDYEAWRQRAEIYAQAVDDAEAKTTPMVTSGWTAAALATGGVYLLFIHPAIFGDEDGGRVAISPTGVSLDAQF